MWKSILESSALILSVVISSHTVYSAIYNYVLRQRQNQTVIRTLQIKAKYLISLANSLATRVHQVSEKYPVQIRSGSQRGGLPHESRDDIAEILIRTFHVLDFKFEWDEEKLASALTNKQINAFLRFLESYQVYREVLTVRAKQLKESPDNAAELKRLSAVTNFNLSSMVEQYDTFEREMQSEHSFERSLLHRTLSRTKRIFY